MYFQDFEIERVSSVQGIFKLQAPGSGETWEIWKLMYLECSMHLLLTLLP